MSVSNPVDSGGIGLNSFDRELQGFAEKLNTVGGWAEIMAEDSKNNTFDTEDNKRSDEPVEDDYADVISHGPPYKLQLLPRSQCDKDELYYFFGGENKVADMIFRDNNRVIITFKDIKDYAFYYREKEFKCNDVSIRAFRIQNNNINRESHPYSRQNSQNQYQSQRDSYSRQGSFHDSSQSLASSHHGDRRQDYDRRYNNRKDYMPPSGYRDDSSRGNNRGRHRGGPRSHYDGPGEIQRSGSYSYDGNRPAPIFRSRTDDGLADRRQPGLMSRTSSQYSVNTEGEKPMAKKPSTRDIFGDAKPVDSTSRLNEVEAKMEGKKKQEAEKVISQTTPAPSNPVTLVKSEAPVSQATLAKGPIVPSNYDAPKVSVAHIVRTSSTLTSSNCSVAPNASEVPSTSIAAKAAVTLKAHTTPVVIQRSNRNPNSAQLAKRPSANLLAANNSKDNANKLANNKPL